MIESFCVGIVAGMRAMTPLALVAFLARRGALAEPVPPLSRATAVALAALAAAELWGDKLPSAPDRTILPGLVGRAGTGAIAAASLAAPHERRTAAILGAVTAAVGAHVTLALRKRAMHRYGQVPTGLFEDAVVLGLSAWIAARRGAI